MDAGPNPPPLDDLLAPEARLTTIRSAAANLLTTDASLEAARRLAEFVVPRIADWCAVDMVTNPGAWPPKRLAVTHVDPERVRLAYELDRRFPPDPRATTGLPQALRTGEVELGTEIPDALVEAAAQSPEHLELIRGLGLKSFVVVPLKVGGEVLGALSLVQAESGRRFRREHLPAIEDVAALAALALQNAKLAEAREQALVREAAARRHAEESEAYLRTVLDNLPSLAWTARPDGHVEYYNQSWHAYTGKSFEELEGWGWRAVQHPEHLEEVDAQWQRSLDTGEPFEMEYRLLAADGVARWFLGRVRPVRDRSGAILHWLGINTDIDDLKAAQALAVAMAEQSDETAHVIEELRSTRDRAERRIAELEQRLREEGGG